MPVAGFIHAMWRRFPWQLLGNTLLLVLEGVTGVVSFVTIAPVIDYFIDPSLSRAGVVTQHVTASMRAAACR